MSVQQLLVETLEELIDEEFNQFKWYLALDVLQGCKPIKRAQLQNAARWDTVSKMSDSYGEELAVSLTIDILKKMGKNGSAAELKKTYEGGKPAPASTSNSAGASPAAPAGMMAQTGSVIIAPSVNGGTSGTWNITVNK
ncbi:pyrin-like isoform 2-T3 [Symphorus nematophorus]